MNRLLKMLFNLVLVIILLTSCSSTKTETIEADIQMAESELEVNENDKLKEHDIVFSESELQEDFNQLKSYIGSHPKLYADGEELEGLLESNYLLINDGMTELEFLRLLTPIVSKLNCGHTSVYLSASHYENDSVNIKYFPLKIYFINNKAYVAQNSGYENIPLGSELLSINSRSLVEITKTLLLNLSADGHNETIKYRVLNEWFRSFYYELVDSSSDYIITYKSNEKSEVVTEILTGTTDNEFNERNGITSNNNEEPYSIEFNEEYAVIDIDSFNPQGGYSVTKYKEFMNDFFEEVKNQNIEHVILDLRDNWGGDPYITSHLFSYLEKTPQPYFAQSAIEYYNGLKNDIPMAENHYDGELYILMNGGSFSSSGHLLALLKYQEVGTFIGEESGGSFACTDTSKNYTLANTKIQYRASTLVWEVDTKGMETGRGIMPDYEVEANIYEYINGVDVVKEYAVNLILER